MNSRPNTHRPLSGPILALGSAFLFGASTPIAKLLLGITNPLLLAGLLYLGSGAGLAFVATGGRSIGLERCEADTKRRCRSAMQLRLARPGWVSTMRDRPLAGMLDGSARWLGGAKALNGWERLHPFPPLLDRREVLVHRLRFGSEAKS